MGNQALPGKRKDATAMDPEDCVIVGLDTDDGEEHPLYDPRVHDPLDEATVKNIMKLGVLQPIIIRKDGEDCQVVVGRRRVRHAREANKRLVAEGSKPTHVLAINRRGSDDQMMGIMIAENEIREDDSPLKKARKAHRLIDSYHWSIEDVAVVFGVEGPTVRAWLRLLDCDDKVLAAVDAGKITANAALPLAQLSREDQRKELVEVVASGKATAKETRARARASKERKKAGQAGDPDHPPEDVEVIVAPGRRLIKRVIAQLDGGEFPDVDPVVVKTLRWVVGDRAAKTVKGLTKVLKAVE